MYVWEIEEPRCPFFFFFFFFFPFLSLFFSSSFFFPLKNVKETCNNRLLYGLARLFYPMDYIIRVIKKKKRKKVHWKEPENECRIEIRANRTNDGKKKKEKEIYNCRVPLKGTAETIFLVLFLYMENVATIWYRALLLSLYIFETRRIIKRRTREFSNCCKKETLFLLPSRWKPWKISWDSLKSAALSSNPSFQQKLKFSTIS